MADYLAVKARPGVLLPALTAHVLARTQAPTDRRADIIHPSEMAKADWCPRATWARIAGIAPPPPERFSMQMQSIFQEGHDVHHKYQTWLWQAGLLWGTWACGACHHRFTATSPQRCEDCASPHLTYAEVVLDAEEQWLISGHEDGAVLDLGALVEIKTVGLGSVRMEEPALVAAHTVRTTDDRAVVDYDGLWKSIRRPLSSHVRQTQVYLALAHLREIPVDKVIFLYENKATQAVKEFTVAFNPDISAPLIEKAVAIKAAIDGGYSMPCPHGRCGSCDHVPKESSDQSGAAQGRGAGRTGLGRSDSDPPSAGDGDAAPARRARALPAERPGGERRRDADGAVRGPDAVERVHGGPGRSSGGRREVRRRTPVPAARPRGAASD